MNNVIILLDWIFQDFWHFIGVLLLLAVIVDFPKGIIKISKKTKKTTGKEDK